MLVVPVCACNPSDIYGSGVVIELLTPHSRDAGGSESDGDETGSAPPRYA